MERRPIRKIIHIDMDAFFAAVEQRDFPEYRDKPLIVGGSPNSRGVVSTCSYEARAFGIHSAMPAAHAYRLCPEAVFVRPRFEAYRRVSTQIREIFLDYSELVEPPSLDEAYLDVSDTARARGGSATLIAREIKHRILEATELTASAGVSYNKFLAKIASDLNKPDGLTVITPQQGPAFIEVLPVGRFHGVGQVTEAKMHRLSIHTGKDLKCHSLESLLHHFGKAGGYYYNIARGIDLRPVTPARIAKSIGAETTFAQDIDDTATLHSQLLEILDRLLAKLQAKQIAARTLTLKVKYENFEHITRSRTVDAPMLETPEWRWISADLLSKTQAGKRKVRLIGLSFSSLCRTEAIPQSRQLDLFRGREADHESHHR